MARGGHHFVKMVTAVRPQQLMRSVIGCLCMPNHFANPAQRVCWPSPGTSPQPRMFVLTEDAFGASSLPKATLARLVA